MDCELARSLTDLNLDHKNDPIDVGPICSRVNKVPTVKQTLDNIKAKAEPSMKAAYAVFETRFPGLLAAQDPPQAPGSMPAAKVTSSPAP